MKTNFIFLMTLLLQFPVMLFARISKAEADMIVEKYVTELGIQDVCELRSHPDSLSEHLTIQMLDNYTLEATNVFPYWINDNVKVNEISNRFVFVDKETGRMDVFLCMTSPTDLENWTRMMSPSSKNKLLLDKQTIICSNLVNDVLYFNKGVPACKVEIIDPSGKIVRTKNLKEGELQMDVSGIPAGTYFVCLHGDKWQVKGKIIIE